MANALLYCQYKASKIGKTGLTPVPTIDVFRVTRSTGVVSQIVTGGNSFEIGGGFYGYTVDTDLLTYDYLGKFITADATVDDQQPGALWSDYALAHLLQLLNLDATISSRLASASYTAPPTAADIDTELSGTHGAGSWLRSSGSGSVEFVYTVTAAIDLVTPIGQTLVWVTTDSAGNNLVASGYTDDFGDVTLYLDAGTYYFWRKKSGYDFTNPDSEVVT